MNAYHFAVAAERRCPAKPHKLCASRAVMAAYSQARQQATHAWRIAAWMAIQRAEVHAGKKAGPWLQAVFPTCLDQASGELDMDRLYEQCMNRTPLADCKAIVKELVRMGAVVIEPPSPAVQAVLAALAT